MKKVKQTTQPHKGNKPKLWGEAEILGKFLVKRISQPKHYSMEKPRKKRQVSSSIITIV